MVFFVGLISMGVAFEGAIDAFGRAASGRSHKFLAFLSGVLFFVGLSLLGIDLISWYVKIR